jgi:hypothetical protein
MSRWRRSHQNGSIKTLLIRQSDTGTYSIIVHEPRGERRIGVRYAHEDLDIAKMTADGLVQNHYPHCCSDDGCDEWQSL